MTRQKRGIYLYSTLLSLHATLLPAVTAFTVHYHHARKAAGRDGGVCQKFMHIGNLHLTCDNAHAWPPSRLPAIAPTASTAHIEIATVVSIGYPATRLAVFRARYRNIRVDNWSVAYLIRQVSCIGKIVTFGKGIDPIQVYLARTFSGEWLRLRSYVQKRRQMAKFESLHVPIKRR